MVEYTLIRSARKTMSVTVGKDLHVTVRAPLRLPQAAIEQFVVNSEGWILRQRERLQGQAALRATFTLSDGERIPFAGGELTLATGEGRPEQRGEELLLPREHRESALAEFLRESARARVAQRVACFAPCMGVQPRSVKITSAVTRWGSCSGKNGLCFSYRVACLPDALLDYVVVHELAHIREHNHSARFWAVVAKTMPDYGERRKALRAFAQRIPF